MAREILIADGNKAAHKAFEEIFKETDYHLIFSENGEDALLKMKLFKPALVIADVTMPDKSGKELCQELKGDPNLNKVPFVLLGGPFDEDIEDEKKQVRADGTITKPLQREPILKLVDGLVMAEPAEGTSEGEEEILELQPMVGVPESVGPQEEEEIIELVDLVDEPVAKPGAAPLEAPGEVMKSEELEMLEEAGLLGDKALADFELPEDIGAPEDQKETPIPGVESAGPGSEISEKVGVEMETAEKEGEISPEEEMGKAHSIEEQYPGPREESPKPETEALEAEEVTEEVPTEGTGELPQDVLKEKSLEEALTEQLEELPLDGTLEPETGILGAEEVVEELPTEGIGESPQDVLKGKGLEDALSEEIEELPGDLLGEKASEETSLEWEDTPDEWKAEVEGLEDLGKETEALREEEGVLEEALRELPGEGLEERGLEKLSGGDISTEEFEWQPSEISQEIDLEGLAEKVLREEDLQTFGEEGQKEEDLEGSHEEVFREGELEKLAEEATRDQEMGEIAEGALAEAIEEFTGETVGEGEEKGVQPSQERPVQETISGAIKELLEGMSAKVLPKLTEAIAAAAAERIEKTVQKIVPAMAEEAIQKEIRKLEKIKKEEEFDT